MTAHQQARALLVAARLLLVSTHTGSLTSSPGSAMPTGINPEAEGLWSSIVHRYSDVIFKGRSIAGEWSTAVHIFERACRARGIAPWLSR